MEANGWQLFVDPLIEGQLQTLTNRVESLRSTGPETYLEHPSAKLLATIHRYMTEIIPRDPNAPEFRQGNTLGADNRHWFRAKFHVRYRLFFRFSTKHKMIIYVWVNDEKSLRKAGSKTDPYSVFRSMLDSGNPPQNFERLLQRSKQLESHAKSPFRKTDRH